MAGAGGRLPVLRPVAGCRRVRMAGDQVAGLGNLGAVVSIRAPAWRATGTPSPPLASMGVSIRAPRGRRLSDGDAGRIGELFRSAPPLGRRPISGPFTMWSDGFDPRPRVEGDILLGDLAKALVVSIRALAWRATVALTTVPAVMPSFDPRPRVEGDGDPAENSPLVSVSIRALAWRATSACRSGCGRSRFRSAPSRGGRHQLAGQAAAGHGFDPRPRVEGDARSSSTCWTAVCFDPRPRVEGDIDIPVVVEPQVVSIRALAWRATTRSRPQSSCRPFRSAPSRGGRHHPVFHQAIRLIVSIRALAWRAT